MPKIKLDQVISFSTEDPVHVAANILNPDPAKKWKCKKTGEKSCSAVIQLEKACVISSIDIGNEHSAYIEVLATRSSQSDDYKVLLVMSSFMTPMDARSSQNINKVRMFNSDQLSKPECEQKWDRIKIVCTQPFNKHVQYGISFIALHSTEDNVVTANSANLTVNIGKFTMRSVSPDDLLAGSLFARRKELSDKPSTTPLKGAAAIRAASATPSKTTFQRLSIKQHSKSPTVDKTIIDSTTSTDRNRNNLFYDEDDDTPKSRIDELIKKKLEEDDIKQAKLIEEKKMKDKKKDTPKKEVKDKDKKETKTNDKKETKTNDKKETKTNDKKEEKTKTPIKKEVSPRKKDSVTSTKKRKSDVLETVNNKKPKIIKNTKPFNELLSGVVLVISGIQNPDRGNLRTMALSMGCKYKPDWDNTCTHLICAFPNTPKFNQVRGKGKIVTKKWISDCHSQRKKLPWRRYALDKNDKDDDESEEEICEKIDDDEENDAGVMNDGGSDTEDEIERIQAMQKNKQTKPTIILKDDMAQPSTSKTSNPISDSDDESSTYPSTSKIKKEEPMECDEDQLVNNKVKKECPTPSPKKIIKNESKDEFEGKHYKLVPMNSNDVPKVEIKYTNNIQKEVDKLKSSVKREELPTLGDFYDGMKFYIDSNMSDEDIAKMSQYIYAGKGEIVDDIIDCDIKLGAHDGNYKDNEWVSKDWIWDCYNNQELKPTDDYKL